MLYLEHRKRRMLSTPSTLLGQLFTRAQAPVNDVCPFCRDDFVDPVRISWHCVQFMQLLHSHGQGRKKVFLHPISHLARILKREQD